MIKPIQGPIPAVRGIAGATELGDQEPVLVLDVSALLADARPPPGGVVSAIVARSRDEPRRAGRTSRAAPPSAAAPRSRASPCASCSRSCSTVRPTPCRSSGCARSCGCVRSRRCRASRATCCGVISLRGEILEVIDLRLRLRLRAAPHGRASRIIVAHSADGGVAGLLVDGVSEVLARPRGRAAPRRRRRRPGTSRPCACAAIASSP